MIQKAWPCAELMASIWVSVLVLSACGDDPLTSDLSLGLMVEAGDNQVRWPGAELPRFLVAQAVDEAGAPILREGIPVTWTVLSGGGTVLAVTGETDNRGRASARWTLGSIEGPQTVEARAGGERTARFAAQCAQPGPLLFMSDQGGSATTLFLMEEDGSNVMQVVSGYNEFVDPDWSPDGSRIVAAAGQDAIVVMDADGSNMQFIVADPAPDARGIVIESPAWSPDGSRIAFAIKMGTECVLSDYNIYTVDPDGGNRVKLTEGCGARNTEMDWSPDGSKIVFTSRRDSPEDINPNLRDIEVWVMNADGSGQTRLTSHGDNDVSPKWAPSGDEIFFQRYRANGEGGRSTLWQMNADGSSKELIREFEGILAGLEISPDGRSLLLGVMVADVRSDLAILDLDTDELRTINSRGPYLDHAGSWR